MSITAGDYVDSGDMQSQVAVGQEQIAHLTMCRPCEVPPDKLPVLPIDVIGYRVWQTLQVIRY